MNCHRITHKTGIKVNMFEMLGDKEIKRRVKADIGGRIDLL